MCKQGINTQIGNQGQGQIRNNNRQNRFDRSFQNDRQNTCFKQQGGFGNNTNSNSFQNKRFQGNENRSSWGAAARPRNN